MSAKHYFFCSILVLAGCSNQPDIKTSPLVESVVIRYNNSVHFSHQLLFQRGDLLLTVDQSKKGISIFDHNLNLIDEIQNPGMGPGEFSNIYSITGNDQYFGVFDFTKKNIELFSWDWTLSKSIFEGYNMSAICLDNSGALYSLSSMFDEWSIARRSESNYDAHETVFMESVRRPYESYGYLYCKEEHLYFASIFTNKIHVISRHGQKVKTILNPYIDEHPEVIIANGVPLPKGPVWNGLFFLEGDLFQIQKKSESTSIFRYNLDTGYLHLFTTPYEIFHAVVNRDTVYAFSTQGLLKYHTHQFLNHD